MTKGVPDQDLCEFLGRLAHVVVFEALSVTCLLSLGIGCLMSCFRVSKAIRPMPGMYCYTTVYAAMWHV